MPYVLCSMTGPLKRFAFLGVTQPTNLQPPFHRVEALPSGAWVAMLTEAPLNLDRSEHLDALKAAYERLSTIGGRVEVAP